MRIQKVWSDRLVASDTKDYATIMKKVNSRTYFDSETQSVLESIMEWPMAFPANKERFLHLGQKGGSTAFVLTDAFYATDKQGKTIECAFFFNNMDQQEDQLISKNFGQFEANIITNADFRQKLAAALK
jgi:D-alanyl-D-alanine carboxypeptidase